MDIRYIDSKKLYYSFIAGAKEVIKNKQSLNKINVFPVADGDTGTNLALTMNWIIRKSKPMSSIVETFKSISDAAISGARGNSGVIFAQYINGITMELCKEKNLTSLGVFTSIKNGVKYAYEAIENPVEGTIITVIRDWAEAMYSFKDSSYDFVEVLKIALERAIISLNKTTDKMEVLKINGVVDSGAKGFVIFLKGFLEYLENGQPQYGEVNSDELEPFPEFENFHERNINHLDIKFKYCTEGLIEGKNIDVKSLRKEIKELGDSLIIASGSTKARIHIHTNNPEKLFSKLSRYGDILEQKVENMKLQQNIVNNRKYKIALVTDSIADIPQDIIDRYEIYQLPLNISIDKSTYLDKVTITSKELYNVLNKAKEHPKSSQPTTKSIEGLYSYLSTYYDSIIVITVSKKMSGTFNVFKKAAEGFSKTKKITVIDSKLNSVSQGLVVLKAAEAIHKGLNHDLVVDTVYKNINRSKIFVSINDLKGMIRSGRLNTVIGIIGRIMNLKPIISIDDHGSGVAIGKAFSINNNTKEIYKIVKEIKEKEGIKSYAIVHGLAENRLKDFYGGIKDIIGKEAEYIGDISPITASSAGENCIAIGLIKE